MPDITFEEMIQRYRQELLQLQQKSMDSAAPPAPIPETERTADPNTPRPPSAVLPTPPQFGDANASTPPVPCRHTDYTESGRLHVNVFTARQAVPLPDADVTVYCTENGAERLYYFVKTDQSGLTPLLWLPAPPAELSESPENTTPYAIYHVRVHKEGYVPAEKENVQIFSGIISTAAFDMVPAVVIPPLPSGL